MVKSSCRWELRTPSGERLRLVSPPAVVGGMLVADVEPGGHPLVSRRRFGFWLPDWPNVAARGWRISRPDGGHFDPARRSLAGRLRGLGRAFRDLLRRPQAAPDAAF